MNTLQQIYIITNLLTAVGLYFFLTGYYGASHTKYRMYRPLFLIVYYLVDCIIYCINTNVSVFLVTSILLFLILSALFNERISSSIIVITVILEIFGICGELLSAYLVSLFIQESSSAAAIAESLIIYKILFFMMLVLSALIFDKKTEPITGYSLLGHVIMPVITIIQVLYVFQLQDFNQYSIQGSGTFAAVLFILSCIGLNIISCLSLEQQKKSIRLKLEQEELIRVIQIQQEHYDNELKTREIIRRTRHDYKNLLIGLKTDLDENNIKNALSTIEDQLDITSHQSLPASGIFAVDSVLSYKQSSAQRYNLTLKPIFKVTGPPSVSNSDLAIMLGNALDNAIEYLSIHPNCSSIITVYVLYDKGLLNIRVENNVENLIPIPDNHLIPSSKGIGHGYGIRSMECITDKYSGKIELICQENNFIFNAIMFC